MKWVVVFSIFFLVLLSPVLALEERTTYIVQLPETASVQSFSASDRAVEVASQRTGRYQVLNLTREELEEKQRRGEISSFQRLERVQTHLLESTTRTGFNNLTSFEFLPHQIIRGNNQTACIIDTGIDNQHPAFFTHEGESIILREKCFLEMFPGNSSRTEGYCSNNLKTDTIAFDDDGHGTHVAGIVASQSLAYPGVAPGSRLVIVKSLDEFGGYMTDIIRGIEFCTEHQETYNISVISMSLGTLDSWNSTETCDADNPVLKTAIDQARAKNITVIASSGNQQTNSSHVNRLSSPACLSNVISVGSVNSNNQKSSFSQGGPLLDIVAPGHLVSAHAGSSQYSFKMGTSMAAPFVAGAVLNILESIQTGFDQTLTPDEVLEELLSNTISINDTLASGYVYPRIHALAQFSLRIPDVFEINATNYTAYLNSTFHRGFFTTRFDEQVRCVFYLNQSFYKERFVPRGISNFIFQLPLGEYNLSLSCGDEVKTVSQFNEVSLVPDVEYLLPDSFWLNKTNNTLSLNFSSVSTFDACSIDLNNETIASLTFASNNYSFSQEEEFLIGNNTFQISCLSKTFEPVYFFVDVTPPNTTLLGVENNQQIIDSYTRINFSVDSLSPAQTFYSFDNETFTLFNETLFLTEPDNYTLFYYSLDLAGNQETLRQKNFSLYQPLPNVTLSPEEWLRNGSRIILTSDFPSNFSFTLLNQTFTGNGTFFEQEVFFSNSSKINTTLNYSVTTFFNTTVSGERNFSFDFFPPNLTVLAPRIAQQNTTVSINISVFDEISGIALLQAGNISTTNTTLNKTILLPYQDSFQIPVFVEDVAGNRVEKNISISLTPTFSQRLISTTEEENNTVSLVNEVVFLEFRTRQAVTNATLSIAEFSSPPQFLQPLSRAPRFFTFEPSQELRDELEDYLLTVPYSSSDLQGVDLSTLQLYWFNETSEEWIALSTDLDFVLEVGRNQTHLFARMTHFSSYSFTGDEIRCLDILSSSQEITQPCYFEDELYISGFICSGSYQTSSCPVPSSPSSGGGSFGGGGFAPAPAVVEDSLDEEIEEESLEEEIIEEEVEQETIEDETIEEERIEDETIEVPAVVEEEPLNQTVFSVPVEEQPSRSYALLLREILEYSFILFFILWIVYAAWKRKQ